MQQLQSLNQLLEIQGLQLHCFPATDLMCEFRRAPGFPEASFLSVGKQEDAFSKLSNSFGN